MELWLDRGQQEPISAPVLDDAQQRVVDHRRGPLLVLAGPGTGKTTTIVESIVARLSDPTDPLRPDEILGLTFGRKAAAELRERVLTRVGGGAVPLISTFHAFAYAQLRAISSPEDFTDPPRLLSGAEEDVRIRILLRGSVEDGNIKWPDDLKEALPTLGLASEVRAVLARAAELGIDPADLHRLGIESGRPAWSAIGDLAEQVFGSTALENVLDYSGLLKDLVYELEEQPGIAGRFRAIFVDEYQDTDPMQVRMLQALVGADTSIVAVGDPDQSIYAFRGADRGGILRFPTDFRTSEGANAPIAILDHTRRFGARIRAAATSVLAQDSLAPLSSEEQYLHRNPSTDVRDDAHDCVELVSYDSEAALAGHVAHEIIRAHIHDGLAWSEIAVLARAAHQIAPIQRALNLAGVPVAIAADEIPLRSEPAVAVLVKALQVVSPVGSPHASAVLELIVGPMGNVDPADLRPVARALRARFRADNPGQAAPSADQLVADALLNVSLLDGLVGADRGIAGLRALGAVLAAARTQVAKKAPVDEVLWTLWSGTSWPDRLRERALRGSTSADHDIDSVMALFDTAERSVGQRAGLFDVVDLLRELLAQQIPAENIGERGAPTDCVRVLSAHRAKGLQWKFVIVVGAQEGEWPDLRPRGSVLQADRLTIDGLGPAPHVGSMLAEERRLFYVACTRARQRLMIAVVDSAHDGDPPVSRFVSDIGLPIEHVAGRRARSLSLAGLISELRTVATDPAASSSLRDAAAGRLAMLATAHTAEGRALAPQAHPDNWWGIREFTVGDTPVRPLDQPIALSASGLESIGTCSLRWYLDREARVETRRSAATAFGSVVHAIADHVAEGHVDPEIGEMAALLDDVWSELSFEAQWQSDSERTAARVALERFLAYHLASTRELLGTEVGFNQVIEVADGVEVQLRGSLDRVERDAEGRIYPIDLKTERTKKTAAELESHTQLRLYQYVTEKGALSDFGDEPGGAALVQLRMAAPGGVDGPLVQTQDALQPSEGPIRDIEAQLVDAALVIRHENFTPMPGSHCRYCRFERVCPSKTEQVIP